MTKDVYRRSFVLFMLTLAAGFGGVVGAAAQGTRQGGAIGDLQRGKEIASGMQLIVRHSDERTAPHIHSGFTATQVRTEEDTLIIEGQLTESATKSGKEEAYVTLTLRTTPQEAFDRAEWDRLYGRPSQ